MTWFSSFFVAGLSALLGLALAGLLAGLAVDWYRISSFEGGSGYFVVFLALLGGAVGFGIGLGVARVVAAGPAPALWKAAAAATGGIVGLYGLIGGVARLLADVPPRIGDETLWVQAELRWPAGQSPGTRTGQGRLSLGSVGRFSNVQRASDRGPLFLADAREEDGRWIVPGVAPLFTSRGRRFLLAEVGDSSVGGWLASIPGHPTAADSTWSDWRPAAPPKDGGAPFELRYRVVQRSEPIRQDTIGAFTVATSPWGFYNTQGTNEYSARSRFAIRFRGESLEGPDDITAVAVLGGEPAALLITSESDEDEQHGTWLLVAAGDSLRRDRVSTAGPPTTPSRLTADPEAFRAARDATGPLGWVDRTTYAEPGLYRLDSAILDTRRRSSHPLQLPDDPFPYTTPGIIAISPDERSLVWYSQLGDDEHPVLGVTDYVADSSYTLPIDRTRMRYSSESLLDPAWVLHHFRWRRGADGRDRLEERPGFTPVPYTGERTLGKPGEWQGYALKPGGEALRQALIEILVTQLGAERLPDRLDGYELQVRLDGMDLGASVIETPGYVSLSTYHGDPEAMARIADRLDAIFAGGAYDSLFTR